MNNEPTGNRPWRFHRRPVFWLIAAIAFCAIACAFTNALMNGPSQTGSFFISTFFALFVASGIWLAAGRHWWRILAVLVVLPSLAVLLGLSSGPGPSDQFLMLCFMGGLVIGVVAFPIFLFRWLRNGRLEIVSADETSVKEVMQFGVFHLFVLTTVVAITISLGQKLIPFLNQLGNTESYIVVTKLGMTLSFGSLVAVWATLGNRPSHRTAISAVAIAGIAFLNYFFIQPGPFQWVYSLMTLFTWAQVTAILWCLRAEGYRFIMLPAHTPDVLQLNDNDIPIPTESTAR